MRGPGVICNAPPGVQTSPELAPRRRHPHAGATFDCTRDRAVAPMQSSRHARLPHWCLAQKGLPFIRQYQEGSI
jgi:hypothetical protein